MTKKNLLSLGIVVLLLVSIVGTAAAQTPEPPAPTPTPAPPSQFFNHPVVQILSAYFSRNLQTPETGPTAQPTTDPNATPDPSATPIPTEEPVDPQEQLAQEIAAYHEQGMGFGVLVKLYAMAEATQLACPAVIDLAAGPNAEPACTAVTVDELVTSFKSGTGMGALFKQYGKPALLGVGRVRKAAKQQLSTPVPTQEVTIGKGNNGNGHKPDKGNNGKKK